MGNLRLGFLERGVLAWKRLGCYPGWGTLDSGYVPNGVWVGTYHEWGAIICPVQTPDGVFGFSPTPNEACLNLNSAYAVLVIPLRGEQCGIETSRGVKKASIKITGNVLFNTGKLHNDWKVRFRLQETLEVIVEQVRSFLGRPALLPLKNLLDIGCQFSAKNESITYVRIIRQISWKLWNSL